MSRGHRAFGAVVVVLCWMGLFTDFGAGQDAATRRISLVQDWSHRHVLFPNGAPQPDHNHLFQDPRLLQAWLTRNPHLWASRLQTAATAEPGVVGNPPPPGPGPRRLPPPRNKNSKIDWAVSLGPLGGIAAGEGPAKFTFDVAKPPDCTNDFVVYTIAATPAAGAQANIIALNNLYTGPTSTSCGVLTQPTFLWSYAAGTGAIFLSPSLSLDGKKVAFVESPAGGNAQLDVLTWTANQGTNATNGSVAPGALVRLDYTNIVAPGCTRVAGGNSNSSPYIDYVNDIAYIGSDTGRLYRITGIFKGVPTVQSCVRVVNANRSLSSPIVDPVSGKVIVSDGQVVYAFTPGPASFTAAGSASIAGTANSIVLSPMLDVTNSQVYVFSSHDAGNTNSIVSQIPVSMASHTDVAIGPATALQFILDGAFDNKFFVNGPAQGSLYACGTQPGSAGNKPSLYTLQFTAAGVIKTPPAMSDNRKVNNAGNSNGTCSPLTTVFNGTNDRLFAATTGTGLVTMWNINAAILSNVTAPTASAAGYIGGTGAFVIDNFSANAQASSVYFGTLGTSAASKCGANNFCAVKLTQSALQ